MRRPTQHADEVRCPECRTVCWPLGYRIPVLQKRDARAWQQLREAQLTAHAQREVAAKRSQASRRSALTREIRRLEAMPSNPGRTKAIAQLRKQSAQA